MTWTSSAKNLAITAKLPYPSSHPKVIGRVPVSSSISFTWFEFMLATAKASHLNFVAPSTAASEVALMIHLVRPHVDDPARDFAILSSARQFKDYVGTFFTGTVGAGLAVLAMVEEGYVWFAHFEALGGNTAPTDQAPDYAMLGPTLGIALLEAKGSAAAAKKTFVGAVRAGYREQVRPHLGHSIGGVTASHGYCVGTWMRFGMDAEMQIAHTAPKAAANLPGLPMDDALDAIGRRRLLRQNYAGAFTLAHSPLLGLAMRSGQLPPVPPLFARFEWRGRRWLSSLTTPDWWSDRWPDDDVFYMMARHGVLNVRDFRGVAFALENDICKAALAAFLGNPDDGSREGLEIGPLDLAGSDAVSKVPPRGRFGEDGDGAVLPDGLALIELPRDGREIELIEWSHPRRQFVRIGRLRL